jgi:hypothetical protein
VLELEQRDLAAEALDGRDQGRLTGLRPDVLPESHPLQKQDGPGDRRDCGDGEELEDRPRRGSAGALGRVGEDRGARGGGARVRGRGELRGTHWDDVEVVRLSIRGRGALLYESVQTRGPLGPQRDRTGSTRHLPVWTAASRSHFTLF